MASRLISTDAGPLPRDLLEDAKYLKHYEARGFPISVDQPFDEANVAALNNAKIEKITVSLKAGRMSYKVLVKALRRISV